ncbi:hypothetical protein IV203_036575 [Nitzschia inconspicua]|uniref:Uncharacterized protein n=1 Tax=Nitzschia inconspicua TaxID=303405 RepID=A0A9K3LFF4_9STRA|nr:hypothetical protein IV203_036575 [Nitzschia inconspicua]
MPSHHDHSPHEGELPHNNTSRWNTGTSICASKKNELSFFMMVGLVAIVLVSTQSVLSTIATHSSSQKMLVDTTSSYLPIQQPQQSAIATSHASTIDTTNPSHNDNHSPNPPTQHKNPPASGPARTSVVLQETGWMQAIVDYRVKMANIALDMEQHRHNHQKEIEEQAAMGNYTMDISPLYDLISEMIDVIGVRGIIFDCLSDEYDYFLYYPDKPSMYCGSHHGVGDCLEHEAWWFYHYTGAIIADKFLRDGKGKILWDGVTGQYVDSFAKLIEGIQHFQQLPRVNEASFHVEHAILWHFLASVMPDVSEYPSDIADTLCRWDSDIRVNRIKGRGVGKGLTHECYHGIGHAAFYVVAKRQARRTATNVTDQKLREGNATNFSNMMFRGTISSRDKGQQIQMGTINATISDKSHSLKPSAPPLVSKENGKVIVSTQAAIELAKATAETSSARTQFRPNIGFELTPDSMCEVYHFCKGAARKSDDHFDDKEEQYPYSHGIRVCLEGVVHSIRLFSADRHNKQEVIKYVTKNMKRCEASEINESATKT